MKKMIVAKAMYFAVSACFWLAGCGSDGSSKDPVKEESSEQPDAPEEEGQEPSGEEGRGGNSESGVKVNPNDEKDVIKSTLMETEDFSIDTIRDSYRGTYSYYLRTGNVVWSLQKVSAGSADIESVCYDGQNGNCDDYGRLFSASVKPAHAVCPDGQNLASSKDWTILDAYRSKHREIDKLLNLAYGGYCQQLGDSLACSGIDTTANYMTSDGKVYSIKKGDLVAKMGAASENGFYNVRCVTYPTFVKSLKDLPACDPSLKNPPERIYVFDERENYRCYADEKSWFPDFTETCTEKNKTLVFDNTMMVCEDGLWQLADISFSPEECNSKNNGKILVFNGEKYACNGSRWREFTDLEDSLGICNSRKEGMFDTLYTGSKIRLYYCNGVKWDDASIETYKGACKDSSSKFMNDTIDFKNVLYVCRGNGWKEYSDIEKQFGVCIPQKLFMFENGSYDVDNYKTEYLCDTTGWKKFGPNDIFGECDSTEVGTVTIYRDKHYRCTQYGDWIHHGGINTSIPRDSMHLCSEQNNTRIISGNYEKVSICRQYSNDSTKYGVVTTEFPKCDKSNEGEEYIHDSGFWTVKAYCGGNGYWHNYYDDLKKCTTANYGELAESKEFGAVGCDDDGWRPVIDSEKKYGLCNDNNADEIKKDGKKQVICHMGAWSGYKDKSAYRVNGSKGEGK